MKLNYFTLLIFAPILILTGISGFILPDGLMSNSTPYNFFHITFGIIGLTSVLSKKEFIIRGFNIGFGIIDLYQALASFIHWFPENYFQWKTADDILHLIIGGFLVAIGIFWKK
jgi:hypothetical protein